MGGGVCNKSLIGGRAFCFLCVFLLYKPGIFSLTFRHGPSLSAFKTGLKTHLFTQYFWSVESDVFFSPPPPILSLCMCVCVRVCISTKCATHVLIEMILYSTIVDRIKRDPV